MTVTPLPTDGSYYRRKCRKKCMGCDPCWICRFSYPASFTITHTGTTAASTTGGVGGVGSGPWVGCYGQAAGTYVPALPFGQGLIDNGVTIHDTFKYKTLLSAGPPAVYSGASCLAVWRFKTNTYQQGQNGPDIFGNYHPFNVGAITRCNGANGGGVLGGMGGVFNRLSNSDPLYPDPYSFEYLTALTVSILAGSLSVFDHPERASDPTSTQLIVRIVETFWGNARLVSPSGQAAYYIIRTQFYGVSLGKPCPRTGTFTMVPYGSGATISNQQFQSVAGYGGFQNYLALPPSTQEISSYSVSVTL